MTIFRYGQAELALGDCLQFLRDRPEKSVHGVVTDPPYGLHEYTPGQQAKLRAGRGGVWRIPSVFRRTPALPVATIHRSHAS